MRLRLTLPAGAALVLLATALAGCGGSTDNGIAAKAPAAIVAAARAAADGASSVHVSGSIVSGSTSIALDMELVAGKGGRGQISESGLRFNLIQTGGTVYISGNSAFYSHFGGPAAARLFQGKWLKAPTHGSAFSTLSSLTDLSELVNMVLMDHGTLTKSAATTVGGQRAIAITDSSHEGTLYVAATGKPYPIEIAKDGGRGGTIAFDRWNAPVALVAPKHTIALSQLESHH